ncbi:MULTISPECIES: helix-turn-helix domain-containing protein [unclassified Pantoea]|uniref:helix-turn-helix domain-containing protein n=1 Tax=unclassified Pantoea TaxID=2630326 RepID=UPI001CD40F23|nr:MULTISPECIES: helix-turn-helix transcriptional regulator [unclassified Pantoea]MCA1174971.1 helix-turn-helix transcriptional regulator [Pantoea sp. alder69]MCA1249933.1 helix-turn-helix transcriptional regulator [Pantoea sp. alder70]MCA1264112.1 helix-turn-helix transcriptional regulator [Pantoea sp. alder81]
MLPGMQDIGRKCQEKRKAKKWTQAIASLHSGVHRTVISQIENGLYSGSLKVLTLYLNALELKLSVQSAGIPQLDELEALFNDE